jgi:hypothetical protein
MTRIRNDHDKDQEEGHRDEQKAIRATFRQNADGRHWSSDQRYHVYGFAGFGCNGQRRR